MAGEQKTSHHDERTSEQNLQSRIAAAMEYLTHKPATISSIGVFADAARTLLPACSTALEEKDARIRVLEEALRSPEGAAEVIKAARLASEALNLAEKNAQECGGNCQECGFGQHREYAAAAALRDALARLDAGRQGVNS